jgi:hypothetical protein
MPCLGQAPTTARVPCLRQAPAATVIVNFRNQHILDNHKINNKMKSKSYLFESKNAPILSKSQFLQRQFRFVVFSALLLAISLGIGMVGYRFLTGMDWVEAFLNASMILTGMGPIDVMPTAAAKIFAGCYSLFSGVVFLSTIAVMFAPAVHRLLHLMHIDESDKE